MALPVLAKALHAGDQGIAVLRVAGSFGKIGINGDRISKIAAAFIRFIIAVDDVEGMPVQIEGLI